MKAVRLHEYGSPDALRVEDNVPEPALNPDDVLVRVRAAGVNPVDWMIRDGYGSEFFGYTLPFTPGVEAAGVVEAVGPDTTRFRPGDAVYGYTPFGRDGAYAEFVATPETALAPKPDTLSFEEAASLPVGALTSWQALDAAGFAPGQSVLVHAAAGGVGSVAVQLARALGAGRIVATASARNHEFVRSLGADEVIDYNTTRFEDAVSGIDVVFDAVGGDTQARSFAVLKPGGALVSLVSPPSDDEARQHDVRATMISVRPDGAQLRQVTELVQAGKLRMFVETVLTLAEVRRALELSQTGHVRGKIVLVA